MMTVMVFEPEPEESSEVRIRFCSCSSVCSEYWTADDRTGSKMKLSDKKGIRLLFRDRLHIFTEFESIMELLLVRVLLSIVLARLMGLGPKSRSFTARCNAGQVKGFHCSASASPLKMGESRICLSSSDPEKGIEGFGKMSLGLADQTRNLSDLPQDVVTEILKRLESYRDFVCATSFCSFWRLIGTQFIDIFSGGYQFPWLMLAEESNNTNNNLRGFYNVVNNKTCYLELPEANGRKKCVSWRGWLVTLDPGLEMNVVHPLSRVQFKLPNIGTSLDLEERGFDPVDCYPGVLKKAVFSSSPGKTSQDYTLCILTAVGRIAMWRKGDAFWRDLDGLYAANMDIVFYRGLFYCSDPGGNVSSWDTQGTRLQRVARFFPVVDHGFIESTYLVESDGSLLLVSRESDPVNYSDYDFKTYKFRVFEVRWCQSDTSDWRPISDLGGRSLFLGFNSSFSISASDFPGCKPNCIYFTDDLDERYFYTALGGGKDMGIYHLEDGHIEHFSVKSFHNITPPLWVELTSS